MGVQPGLTERRLLLYFQSRPGSWNKVIPVVQQRRFFYPNHNRFGLRREDLVKQAEHGNEQQADERPDDLGEGVHLRSESGELSLQPVDPSLHLRPEFGDLSLQVGPELGDLSMQVGPKLGDLGTDGGGDVLPAQVTHLLNGGMDQLGVRAAVDQDPMNCAGFRFRRGRNLFLPFRMG